MMAFAFRVRLQVQRQDEAAARALLASSVESIGDQWETSDDGV